MEIVGSSSEDALHEYKWGRLQHLQAYTWSRDYIQQSRAPKFITRAPAQQLVSIGILLFDREDNWALFMEQKFYDIGGMLLAIKVIPYFFLIISMFFLTDIII